MMRTIRMTALPLLLVLGIAGCGRETGREPASGTLEAVEVRVAPALSGRVLELRAAEGTLVAAGDTLLILDAELLGLQRIQSASGLAALDARLRRIGDQAAEAGLQRALAERSLERLASLHQTGSATDQQLDEARTQRDLALSREQGVLHERGVLATERASLEAALAVQDRQLRDAALLAPGPGTVLERYTEPGEWIAPGQPALLLADLSQMELRFYLGEQDLDLVKLDQLLEIRVDALPGEALQGRVSWISREAEFTPKNVQTREARARLVYAVRAMLPNPDGRLLIGMPAEAMLEPVKP